MNFLGVDYGRRWVGAAFSQGLMANGIGTWPANEALNELARQARELQVAHIVIGLPSGRLVQEVKAFGAKLAARTGIKVTYWDETLTTHKSQQALVASSVGRKKRSEKEHAIAAALLLESYMEMHR
jgi:putative Holliday junction resolvase